MEDWLNCQVSSLVKYRQNQFTSKVQNEWLCFYVILFINSLEYSSLTNTTHKKRYMVKTILIKKQQLLNRLFGVVLLNYILKNPERHPRLGLPQTGIGNVDFTNWQ